MRENRTSGSEGREPGNQPGFLTPIFLTMYACSPLKK